jgi:hypothetical protein
LAAQRKIWVLGEWKRAFPLNLDQQLLEKGNGIPKFAARQVLEYVTCRVAIFRPVVAVVSGHSGARGDHFNLRCDPVKRLLITIVDNHCGC